MYVLIDIEWVQQDAGMHISQFAAIRVTADCESVADFQCLVCPVDWRNIDWQHMAYSGYLPDEFKAGVKEQDCIKGFLDFLMADDTICCWHSDTKHLLEKKCEVYANTPIRNKIICLNDKIRSLAMERGMASLGLYALAAEAGIDTPVFEHQSVNDVYVLRSLLSALGYNLKRMQGREQEPQKKAINKRERNADILTRVNYNYIFTPHSQVFHSLNCRLMLSANDIKGCVYYKTAVQGRRPCKVCRPELMESAKPVKTEKAKSVPKQPEKNVVMAKMLGDRWVEITSTKIVGYCHSTLHPGNLTRKILVEHDCIGKDCKFFEKYVDSSFWIAEENKKRQKAEKKAMQQLQKKAVQKMEEELGELKNLLQSHADNAEHKILIIRIEKEQHNRYKVFYVSEFTFADGNRFPDFLQTVKRLFPQYSIQLRHIRDMDGHFVTTDEYAVIRKRKK